MSCAVKAPGFGDRRKVMLEDIAILTRRQGHHGRDRYQAGGREAGRFWGAPSASPWIRRTPLSSTVTAQRPTIEGRIKQLRTQIEETTSITTRKTPGAPGETGGRRGYR